MVDYVKLPTDWKPSDLEQRDEVQEEVPPVVNVDVVWNVYQEKGNTASFALKVVISVPLKL
jgi:hypothetical protein